MPITSQIYCVLVAELELEVALQLLLRLLHFHARLALLQYRFRNERSSLLENQKQASLEKNAYLNIWLSSLFLYMFYFVVALSGLGYVQTVEHVVDLRRLDLELDTVGQ